MPALASIGNASFAFREMTSEEAKKNAQVPTIDFTLDYFFSRFISASKNVPPLETPKTLGDHFKILSAATGSGKGSIGFEIYMRYWQNNRKSIAVLEPTITTAISIPIEIVGSVPKIRAEFSMGKNVGYQTGDFVRKPISGVLFMTNGVLCQMLRVMTDAQFMRRFSFILLDEAHMRRLDTDIILWLLKQLLQRNLTLPECPMVIAMSGTMPIRKYAKYMSVNENDVISVNVQQFKKTEHYAKRDVDDFVEEAIKTIVEIHTGEGKEDQPELGDIIVFIPSAKSGTAIAAAINEKNDSFKRKVLVTNVNSDAFRIGTEEYFNVRRPLSNSSFVDVATGKIEVPQRRIIIGTPVMEAGLTIETAKYCIETGVSYAVQYDPVHCCIVRGQKPITLASAKQRIGRIGRKFPGSFYTMYTKKTMDAMEEQPDPDIWISDIAATMLNFAVGAGMPVNWTKKLSSWPAYEEIGVFDPLSLDLVDAPSADSLNASLEKLFVLGFLDAKCKPTQMGALAVRFPKSSLENLRMIFEGYIIGANIEDLITMAAIIEADPGSLINTNAKIGPKFTASAIFETYDGTSARNLNAGELPKKKSDWHEKQKYVGCDIIELLFIFYEIREQISDVGLITKLREWMLARGLVYEQWMRVFIIRDQLIEMCIASGLDPYINGLGIGQHKYLLPKLIKESKYLGLSEIAKLKMCLVEGYRLNVATWSSSMGCYIRNLRNTPLTVTSILQSHVTGPNDVESGRPNKIIVFDISLTLPKKSVDGAYAYIGNYVSVLDNLALLDETFAIS